MKSKPISSRGVRFPQWLAGALAFAVMGLGASVASAQAGSLSKDDVAFLKDASQGGLYEVEIGKYAADKGKADSVKDFGRQMATDHAALNRKLGDVAAKNGLTLDTEPSAVTSAKIKTETVLSGAAFDKTYLPLMVHAHKADIAAFEKEAAATSNADLKAAITDALPTLRHHLKMAKQAKAAVSNS